MPPGRGAKFRRLLLLLLLLIPEDMSSEAGFDLDALEDGGEDGGASRSGSAPAAGAPFAIAFFFLRRS
jgi:hypothetical protein